MSTTASIPRFLLRIPELRFSGPQPPAGRQPGRCLVVSDRLPILLTREGGRGWRVSPASGALISALTTVLRDRRGVWIGWPGVAQEETPGLRKVLAGAIHEGGFSLRPVMLTALEKRHGYGGFSGEVVWPLFHDLAGECDFQPAHWQGFLKVNRKFARVTARTLARGASGTDLVWVHDHLLMNLALELRRLGVACRKAFFLHLPFPSPDLFLQLPWREQVLSGLLAFDQIGFQTERDLECFLAAVRRLAPATVAERTGGGLWSLRGSWQGVAFDVRAGAFPSGSTPGRSRSGRRGRRWRRRRRRCASRCTAASSSWAWTASTAPTASPRSSAPSPRRSPAIPSSRSARPWCSSRSPAGRASPGTRRCAAEIERLAGEINGAFGRPGWVPVHYLHREPEADERLAYYRAADVALVTPLKAGMHLMAKEYCAANLEGRGTLVLSEFAGAAPQLAAGALMVNPFDTQAVARTLRRALKMKSRERGTRMRRLREAVRTRDVFWWAESCLAAASAGRLDESAAKIHFGIQ